MADQMERVLKTLKWAHQSQAAPRIEAMLKMARSEEGVSVLPADLDRDPWLLNCANGTIELRTGRLREHRREDLITKVCPVAFDPEAKATAWERFLLRIMARNEDLIRYLQRAVGYSLTGDVGEQCLFFLHGDGSNGKSTFLGLLLAILGDYAMQANPEMLMLRGGEAHPTERADLFGKRFVGTVEVDDGKRMAEALIKQLTGGDRIRARRMREDHWEFLPTHKFWLAANHKPVIRGTDHAIWRRIKMIPFGVTISEEEKDKDLPAKLLAEAPGVLAWAIRGCLDWQRHGLGEPEEVKAATDLYRSEQDIMAAFIAELCIVGPDYRVRAAELFRAFSVWLEASGERGRFTNRRFCEELRKRKFEDYTNAGLWFQGLALRNNEMN